MALIENLLGVRHCFPSSIDLIYQSRRSILAGVRGHPCILIDEIFDLLMGPESVNLAASHVKLVKVLPLRGNCLCCGTRLHGEQCMRCIACDDRRIAPSVH